MALNLFAIPPGEPFLDSIAEGWLRDHGPNPMSIANGLILTPTRRAARSLAEAFLRISAGRGLLLPRIVGLGAMDEQGLTLEGALDLPPAVDPFLRLSILAHLILRMNGAGGAPRTADRAWTLAKELALLMDEADRAEIDLASRLPDAADPAYAAHWSRTLEFLRIVTHAWPGWLAENGVMNPAARQVALLNAQAAAWKIQPPPHTVLFAGATGGIPAVARLASVVARMPLGQVVLPVLDMDMSDAAWTSMADSHPQSGLARLLAGLDATRGDVRPWGSGYGRNARFALLSRALLPAEALSAWQSAPLPVPDGMWRLKPRDAQEEAEAIALLLRHAMETPGRTAAFVTPDRELATRVAATLPRHGIVADDSAGEKLAETPPAVFLRLLAWAVTEELAPVALLALLKHPLAAAGLSPAACRQFARALELAAFRGPKPMPGLAGLRLAVVNARGALSEFNAGGALSEFLALIEACLEPMLRQAANVETPPVDALTALIAAAERLAATDTIPGDTRLWAEEEGDALATLLTAALAALPNLPPQRGDVLPGLLDALLEGTVVRSRRALRGRDGMEHPRVFIWGPLEARLQSADVVILGGLVETVWPPAVEPGPWLSRPMRAAIGLPSPEEAVGLAAHDFLSAAVSAPAVILSCPDRRDGAPAVPARWLVRLETLLNGTGAGLPVHAATDWVRGLDRPHGPARPSPPPRPCPPVAVRPSRLSVTEVETWLRDPYAIYAKHILRLTALDPLEQETDAADYGNVVHEALSTFFRQHGAAWPDDADTLLRRVMRIALASSFARPALAAWWEPRLDRIAGWVAEIERGRREAMGVTAVETEKRGYVDIQRPGRRFRLVGQADRIERREDDRLAIVDYKTGHVPSVKAMESGWAPQLPLEAAMAGIGGFGPEMRAPAVELIYWHLTGGFRPGEIKALMDKKNDELTNAVENAIRGLEKLIDHYDEPDRCYLARPYPALTPRFSDYTQLARVAEWSAAAVSDDEGAAV